MLNRGILGSEPTQIALRVPASVLTRHRYTGTDGTAEYHYDITVTRPYPRLRVLGVTQNSHVENRTELIGKYGADGPGHSVGL